MRKNNMVRYNVAGIADKAKSFAAKVGAVAAGGLASGLAFAGGGGTPGSIIAGTLSGGTTDLNLVFAAVGLLIGALIVWAYIKRAR